VKVSDLIERLQSCDNDANVMDRTGVEVTVVRPALHKITLDNSDLMKAEVRAEEDLAEIVERSAAETEWGKIRLDVAAGTKMPAANISQLDEAHWLCLYETLEEMWSPDLLHVLRITTTRLEEMLAHEKECDTHAKPTEIVGLDAKAVELLIRPKVDVPCRKDYDDNGWIDGVLDAGITYLITNPQDLETLMYFELHDDQDPEGLIGRYLVSELLWNEQIEIIHEE